MVQALEKAQAIYDAEMVSFYHYGKEDGIQKGIEVGRMGIAKKLLDAGHPVEEISRLIRLPAEEILSHS